jgi:hypothetical protein
VIKNGSRWCCWAVLVGLAATVAAQEKRAPITSQTDALETVRAAVEKRLTYHTEIIRSVAVTAVSANGSRMITVIASLRSLEPDSWPEDVADIYTLIWHELTKSKGLRPSEGFKIVDRIVVRATGLEGFFFDCPVKVLEESPGKKMTLERLRDGCKP